MRFWGYIGCHLDTIIFPLLVYKITGDPSIAGIVFFAKFTAKFFVYLSGGSFMARIGTQRSHYLFDSARVLVFLLAGLSCYLDNWALLIISGILISVSNALSNIVFEGVVSKLEMLGQIRIRQADLLSGLVVLPLAFALPVEGLIGLGLFLYLSSLLMIRYMKPYYGPLKSSDIPIRDSLNYIRGHRSLPWLIAAGFFLSIVPAIISPVLPFFIGEVNSEWVTPFYIAGFNALNYLIAAGCLGFFSNHKKNDMLPIFALALAVAGLFTCLFASGWLIFAGLIMIVNAAEVYRVWTRAVRQDIFPQKGRMPLTGTVVGIETSGYALAGLLLAFSNLSVMENLALIAPVALILSGVFLLRFVHNKKGRQVRFMPRSLRSVSVGGRKVA